MDMKPTPLHRAKPVEILPRFDAKDLTEGGQLAEIILDDQVYRLRITKAGKLILTK